MTTWQEAYEKYKQEKHEADEKKFLPRLDPRLETLSIEVWGQRAKIAYLEDMLESTKEALQTLSDWRSHDLNLIIESQQETKRLRNHLLTLFNK